MSNIHPTIETALSAFVPAQLYPCRECGEVTQRREHGQCRECYQVLDSSNEDGNE